jgi:hypothetical protein
MLKVQKIAFNLTMNLKEKLSKAAINDLIDEKTQPLTNALDKSRIQKEKMKQIIDELKKGVKDTR